MSESSRCFPCPLAFGAVSFSDLTLPTGAECYLIVLIWVSLMTGDVEPLSYTYLLPVSFEKCPGLLPVF